MSPYLCFLVPFTLFGASPLVAADSSVAAPVAPVVSSAPSLMEMLPASGQMFAAKKEGTLRALLVGGGSSHDFEKVFHQTDKTFLNGLGNVDAIYTSNAEEAVARMSDADVLVLSANHKSFGLSAFQDALKTFADSGKGLVIVHAGVWHNWPPATGYNTRFVGGGAKGHGKGVFSVSQVGKEHPVLAGVAAKFEITDELYYPKFMEGAKVVVLAETQEDEKTKQKWPSVWVVDDEKARVVCIALGHAEEAHGNPAYQRLLQNAVLWTGKK